MNLHQIRGAWILRSHKGWWTIDDNEQEYLAKVCQLHFVCGGSYLGCAINYVQFYGEKSETFYKLSLELTSSIWKLALPNGTGHADTTIYGFVQMYNKTN